MHIRTLIDKGIDWVLSALLVFLLGTLLFLASVNAYLVLSYPNAHPIILLYECISAVIGYTFLFFYTGLLIGNHYHFGWKKLTAIVLHKLLDWRVVCNPLTTKWYLELYERK